MSLPNIYDTAISAPDGYAFSGVWEPSVSNESAAFLAYFHGFNRHSIFLGDGRTLAPVVSDRDAVPLSPFLKMENPALSDGSIAFVGYRTYEQHGVFKYDNGTITPIAETGDSAPANSFTAFDYRSQSNEFPHVSISNGTVAFRGVYGFVQEGIFSGDGGPLTTIAKTGDPAPESDFGAFGDPAMSGDTVAFRATYSRGRSGIFTSQNGVLTTIAKNIDPAPEGLFSSFSDPTISGNTVAFQAAFAADKAGIFTGDGGPLTTIVKQGDPAPVGVFHFPNGLPVTPPTIAGDSVAFHAYYGETTYQNQGIFVNRDGMNSLVIKKGDSLFGGTVRSLGLGKYSLDTNGSGTLAFIYGLEDNRGGIAFARLIPEPASAVLFASAATILLVRRRV